jgi:serine/threonine protein kinase
VAIKVCHPHLRHEDEFTAMFLDEARLAARIHHPNVVSTLDVSEGAYLYLVMEYIEGDRISGLIKAAAKRGERVPVPVALRVMIDVLNGLHAAHELRDHQNNPFNIVHRDVSPQNILVGVDGVSRITDFGIAKAEARLTVTREGQVKGKMSYMAPEQLQSHKIDRRADVYAAAVVLWEALTGRRLFRADSDAETLHLVLNADIPAPSSVVPGMAPPPPPPEEETTGQLAQKIPAPPLPPPCITPALDAVVMRALERDPEKRYATAEAFADALEDIDGIRVANARAVATYINELLSDMIQKRRELVRRLSESGPQAIEHSGVRASLGSAFEQRATMTGLPAFRSSVPPMLPVASAPPGPTPSFVPVEVGAMEIEPEPAPPSRRGLVVAFALVAALSLLVAVAAVVSRRAPPPNVAQTVVAPTPAAQPPAPAPTPAVAAPTPAPTPTPPIAPVAAPTPPEPVAPAVEPAPAEVAHRPVRPLRPVRPAVRPARPVGGAAPPSTTASQGSGEFRPSGI